MSEEMIDAADDDEPHVIDETPNAADPASIKRARKRNGFEEDQRADYWRNVIATPLGRKCVWELLISVGTFEDRFGVTPAGFACSESTWLQAGEKRTGQRLYRMLMKYDPAAIVAMHVENDHDVKTPTKRVASRSEND